MSKHKRRTPTPEPAQPPPKTAIGDLTLIIADLVTEYSTRERYTWHEPKSTRTERREHRTSGRGLLAQLGAAAGLRPERPTPPEPDQPVNLERLAGDVTLVTYRSEADASAMATAATFGGIRYDESGHSKPGSRLPAGSVYVDEYARLVTEIWEMRARLAKAQGVHWLPGGDPAEALGDILRLAVNVDDELQRRAVSAARSWCSATRVALQYDAPWMQLRNPCPHCGGVLKVRADATSDVWCRGGPQAQVYDDVPWSATVIAERLEEIQQSGCGARWPRAAWVDLLVDLNQKGSRGG